MLWTRPSGSTIELEDTKNLNTFALSQGWTKEEVKAVVKRKRRTKEEMINDNRSSSNKGNTARDTS